MVNDSSSDEDDEDPVKLLLDISARKDARAAKRTEPTGGRRGEASRTTFARPKEGSKVEVGVDEGSPQANHGDKLRGAHNARSSDQ